MLGKLILLFVLVPLLDMIFLAVLSSYIGWPVSVALVVLSGIAGAVLAKLSYRYVLLQLFSRTPQLTRLPNLLADGALIFFASGLLLTPGFLTDIIGLTMLIPSFRKGYKFLLAKWFKVNLKLQQGSFQPSNAFEPRDSRSGSFSGTFFDNGELNRHRSSDQRKNEKGLDSVIDGEVVGKSTTEIEE